MPKSLREIASQMFGFEPESGSPDIKGAYVRVDVIITDVNANQQTFYVIPSVMETCKNK